MPPFPRRAPLAAAVALSLAGAAQAQVQAPSAGTLPGVTIQGNYDNAVGSSDAASQGVVTSRLLESRPTLRPAEVLEFVPGVIVTQHSGDGKANQYFLRGFNLDHGTDFATSVDGMPVNMPSHAHGQGYSDLNWLIPELVDRIAYRKGPYYADEGDFSSAGAAHIRLFDTLPQGLAQLTVGQRGYGRGLVAGSTGLATGNLLYAFEAAHNDGPWQNPEKFHRTNAVLRYSLAEGPTRWSVTGMAYNAGWNATDQIPQRAVDAGLIDRFGAVDPTDGGRTARYSLSLDATHRVHGGEWKANAYLVRSRLDLFSNFTFLLDNPADVPAAATGINGDQFAQSERRTVAGGAASRRWETPILGRDGNTTVGVQLRQDRLDPVGLYSTEAQVRAATIQESRVRQSSVGVWAQNDTQWLPWLRGVLGLRTDHYDFDVTSSIAQNSGRRSADLTSPKLSLIFGPWAKTEYFLNAGRGFHSNDARGTVTHLTPRELQPTDPSTPLVRTKGAELGVRTEIIPGVQSSLALWQLELDSELVFSGDAGDTEPSRASRRQGIEWNTHWQAASWLLLDADLAFSKARFTQDDPAGNHVPGAVGKVASVGATVTQYGPWFGQFQLRYFGPRPLIEDNSQRSASTTLAYLRVGYRVTPKLKLALDVFNLFDRKASDIDYFYVSRLAGEPLAGVADRHFHPVEPRSLRLTLSANY
ncbi:MULTISPECIES: TonB-dependent receptor [Ramlibacter]|uniref:TonB-dependent receptor plug domain-containing protein n=1 Tax=Ramlibacter pinisoli TaxID=2682844 RepID=A0A6N8IY43_9BURK|nr:MULTISPECIES: TonB-dependent receptor [Ramlibacter]MBA2961951.1 TonB-dependent receptor [Ramlibacter sp. CGMCC 1.13660]MVQ31894.1 TonB-dependent receptor plug domain-containing protein [Ramlibacter pinisoli]